MKNEDMNAKIGAWMRKKRQEARLSQQEVAERMGHTRTAVYYWENGKRTIYATNLLEFCKVMNIDPLEAVGAVFYGDTE